MDDGGSSALAGQTRRIRRPIGPAWAARGSGLLTLAALVTLAVGCSHSPPPRPAASSASRTKVTTCGSTKTAADVPVDVEVIKGEVPCATALRIEHAYAEAIRSGRAPGNGGGGPVRVQGWTCQGFPTPVVLATGKASKCVKDGAEILEILPPTGSG